ncbi:hypothetical protein [Ekhidna sp.]
MGYLFNFFAKKDAIKLSKSDSGEWMVKKNFSILYIGSKEKCQTYMQRLKVA